MDFGFEDVEEAFFADLLAGFGAFEDCSGFCAEGAELWGHCILAAGEVKLEGWEDPRKSDRAEEKRVRVMTRSAQKTFSPPESGDSVDNVECLEALVVAILERRQSRLPALLWSPEPSEL